MLKILITSLPGRKKKALVIYDSENNVEIPVAYFTNDEMANLFSATFSVALDYVYNKGIKDSKFIQENHEILH